MKPLMSALVCLSILTVLTLGCGSENGGREAVIKVTATTGMVGELAARVGGERVSVTTLMGPGVDPHLYKASEGDIARLTGADLILYNGLNLEGKMGDILVKLSRRGTPTMAVTDGVEKGLLITPPELRGHYDPHVWFDVGMWARTMETVVEGLSRVDPAGAAEFEANAQAYRTELAELHRYCRDRIADIPKERRVLVTAHDAFGYFGRAYDIEVVGLQGMSTNAEYGLKDVRRIVDLITARKLKAVFVESSVPRRSIEAVVAGCEARGHKVAVGGMLFSDAMGEPGTPEGTYAGMVRHNVETIVSSLE